MKEIDVLKRQLTRRMDAKNLTPIGLATEAGLPRDTIRDILRDHVKAPGVFAIAAVAARLGCSVEALLGRKEADGSNDDSSTSTLPRSMTIVAALDVQAAGGGGTVVEREDTNGHFGFPPNEFDAPPDRIKIVEIVGDSMYKPGDPSSLQSGDRVAVDIGLRVPSPPGIFVLFDGVGVVVKCIEPITKTKKIRVFSLNTNYTPYELSASEAHIHGRVIGVWRRV